METAPKRSGGRITWTTDLWYLIGYAYRLQPNRISGPIPGSDHIYQLSVKTAPDATDDQVRRMFQSLLADRFQMRSHRVTKDAERYVLSLGKGGLKMREAKPDDTPSDLDGRVASTLEAPGIGKITGRRVSISQLSDSLQRILDAFVVDETGLAATYDFSFRYARDDRVTDSDVPSLPVAMQRELGLKLEKRKGPVEMLVVDHIDEKPVEN